jgi:glutathione S-transferase
MILIGQYDSPFVRRVAVTLHTYRILFERQPYSVFGDIGHVRVHNPLVRVPVLVLDEGEVLIDSGAIIDHLDEMVGRAARALIPHEGPLRRRALYITAIAHGCAEKVVQLFFERYFHDTASISRDWESRCIGQIESSLETLDAICPEKHWIFGERISHADIMIGCMIGHLQLRVPELWPATKYAKLRAFAARCELNKAFVAARIGANETIPERG